MWASDSGPACSPMPRDRARVPVPAERYTQDEVAAARGTIYYTSLARRGRLVVRIHLADTQPQRPDDRRQALPAARQRPDRGTMIRAVIFDLDGTLVKTEQLKGLSYARAVGRLSHEPVRSRQPSAVSESSLQLSAVSIQLIAPQAES